MRRSRIDLAVIGAGPAGLAAAIAAAKAGVGRIALFERQTEPGGILQQCIHNGFGLYYFREELTGPEYAQRFIDRLTDYPQIHLQTASTVVKITPQREIYVVNEQTGIRYYQAKAIILAMGCRERPRGALKIPGTRPAGIFTAGTVQQLMNIYGLAPGKEAVILGSGDIGLIMARRLTLEGIKVRAVVEILPCSTGLKRNLVQCLEDFSIPLYLRHTVTRINGEKRLTSVTVAPVNQDLQPIKEQAFTLPCDTLILSVGLIPENELSLMAGVELDPVTKGPLLTSTYQTTVPGIFACGNVAHVHDLVDDVSIEGEITGQAAAAFLNGESPTEPYIPLRTGRNIRTVVPQYVSLSNTTTLYIRPLFPEEDVTLKVGPATRRFKAVTPGETIRFRFDPTQLKSKPEKIPVSLEVETCD
ncbi:MAG TPA: FAD-dependent oxidoreductase [Hydrogenispora sp.]|nr:FAD-dependent oxidoreductase [Hydrogenispora sp.]